MDLGQQARERCDRASVDELLTDLATEASVRAQSQIREWVAIAAWADRHVVEEPEGAATLLAGVVDTGVPVGGPGTPLVSEFALMELIAVLGRSPDGGRAYVGRVLACCWRLPHVWDAVMTGRLAAWRAERIADLTMLLNDDAVAFVDRQLFRAAAVGWAQLQRLVDEAVLRFDPEAAEARRRSASARDHCDVGDVDRTGKVQISGVLDAADGRAFDDAVRRRARLRGQLGDDAELDVRRARAVGDMARQDLELDLVGCDPETGEVATRVVGRTATLTRHITDTTLAGDNPVGRWAEGRTPITAAQIREWLGDGCTTRVVVRPVVDLADCVPVDSYEIPDRLRRRVVERDHACRFPGCVVPAERCDLDHQTSYDRGGATCPCNLVPLCRRHHRAKTFSRWRHATVLGGHYLWASPHGRFFLVSPEGTRSIDLFRSCDPDDWWPPD